MSLAELVAERVKALPEPLLREVLDLIDRLEQKPWRDLIAAQSTGLRAVWDNAQDAVWDEL